MFGHVTHSRNAKIEISTRTRNVRVRLRMRTTKKMFINCELGARNRSGGGPPIFFCCLEQKSAKNTVKLCMCHAHRVRHASRHNNAIELVSVWVPTRTDRLPFRVRLGQTLASNPPAPPHWPTAPGRPMYCYAHCFLCVCACVHLICTCLVSGRRRRDRAPNTAHAKPSPIAVVCFGKIVFVCKRTHTHTHMSHSCAPDRGHARTAMATLTAAFCCIDGESGRVFVRS